jgi:glycosyltransferase involved in cell wall biosynthesis
MKKILFVDQTGKLGGAELALLEVAKPYREHCLVVLFENGPFRNRLEEQQIPVQVLATQPIQVRKESNFWQNLGSLPQILPAILKVAAISHDYDLIVANTQKALVVGAIASLLSRKPLAYYLHDILSAEHFSPANCRIAVTLANTCARLVIADSKATEAAFVAAGGRAEITETVYYGFEPEQYQNLTAPSLPLRQELEGRDGNRFIVGHFSRLSPWKGQHLLLEALAACPADVMAVFVGDALFGERDYVEQLHAQIARLGLQERVRFLGFRSDVPQLMAACDLVAHTSTAPEPFGRVIVEAMLCGRPVVAAKAGGAIELVEEGKTGWLCPPGDPQALAEVILGCRDRRQQARAIAQEAQRQASLKFNLTNINRQLEQLFCQCVTPNT